MPDELDSPYDPPARWRRVWKGAMTPSDPRVRLTQGFVMQLITWIVAALLTYAAVNARVAVLETKEQSSEQRMERIENKVDRVLEVLRK